MNIHHFMSQLFIDFDSTSPVRSARTGEVRAQSKIQYHADASSIESSRFALKMSLRSRSFLVKGVYHVTNVSQFMDESLARIVDYVHIDRVFTYRNGQYADLPVLKNEEIYIMKATKEILQDPYNNPFLTLQHERAVEH